MTTYESYYCNKEHASPDECNEDLNLLMDNKFFNLKRDIEMVDRFISMIANRGNSK